MAFGDKFELPIKFKTDTSILTEGFDKSITVLVPLPLQRLPASTAIKRCCDEPDNMAVEDNGDCICLKCRRVVGVEHFNKVLGC